MREDTTWEDMTDREDLTGGRRRDSSRPTVFPPVSSFLDIFPSVVFPTRIFLTRVFPSVVFLPAIFPIGRLPFECRSH